ncbi:inositol-3-phosphate synthase [Candidatus Bathyarchaeota archaeon]|nr:MAG: inositol-3-phosphate synthase [Candidatus Bathyarchaeota archaeon]
MREMGRIKVAVAGVGNCCSALVQGVYYYREAEPIGLLHEKIGGYGVGDIEFVAAFDIDGRKVGRDLSEAIFSEVNEAPRFAEVPRLGVEVRRGPVLDGVSELTKDLIVVSDAEPVDVAEELRRSGAEILVNLISGGAEEASRFYAEEALKAGCAFINATPSSIASDPAWAEKFEASGLPLVGDDLLDQVGATALHMALLEFLHMRGVRIEESFQLDVGGGMEALNTLARVRGEKRRIKTEAVAASIPYEFPLVSGSTDYVDFLGNSRDSFLWIKGRYYGGATFTIDLKLGTVDAPNAGSVLLDVIRAVKLSLDRGLRGVVTPISAYAFKNPPKRFRLSEAHRLFEEFIAG